MKLRKSLTQYCLDKKNQQAKALVTYVTAGLDSWIDTLNVCCDNGSDILEVGLPFSDPVMDGPIIAQASAKAIATGAKTLTLLDDLSKHNFSKPVVIMTYANVLYSHGVKEIIKRIEDAGVKGLIIPDLTYEQSDLFASAIEDTDISLIPLVSSTTEPTRREKIVASAEGFLYCVAIKGITGQDVNIATSYTGFIEEINSMSSVSTYCGVGIRTPQDAKNISSLCDGVIVGTSIVQRMLEDSYDTGDVASFVSELRSAID